MIGTMRDILGRLDVDYADLRHEVRRDTTISFDGRDLTEAGTNEGDGYVLRVLDRGGFATVAFTDPADTDDALRTATANARLLGVHLEKPVVLAVTEPAVDTVIPDLDEDPRAIGLDEKLELVARYNAIPLTREGIATTIARYSEVTREKHFVSTEGAAIREDLVTTGLKLAIVAREGSLTQDVRMNLGGSGGFHHLRDREDAIEGRTRMALDLLDARPVGAGSRDCILSPLLAGVFAHEAFGHRSEADGLETQPAFRAKMVLGARLGSAAVSIVDDATRPGQLAFCRYDDEGVPIRRVPLLEHGVLAGRLHSRRTAAAFGEPLTGHGIAEDYRYAPIVRMGCITIEPGEHTFDALLGRLGDGLYVVDPKGGQTSGETFSFGAQCAYEVKNGRLGAMVRDLNILGNLFRTLRDIEAVGDEVELSEGGTCGKVQGNIRSGLGGPHVLIRDLLVGGA